MAGITVTRAGGGASARQLDRIRQQLAPASMPVRDRVMSSPPTIGPLASATAIASPKTWRSNTQDWGGSGNLVNQNVVAYSNAAAISHDPSWKGGVRAARASEVNGADSFRIHFWFDGTTLEVYLKGTADYVLVWVDGELAATSATSLGNSGLERWLPITFGSRAMRQVTVTGIASFAGLVTAQGDSVFPAPPTGPRCMVVGDSFTSGSGDSNGYGGWAERFGRLMGWDVHRAYNGGSGWLTGGQSGYDFTERVAEVVAEAPDVVVWAGGYNDASTYTGALVGAAAASCLSQVAAALPGTLQVVIGPWGTGGVHQRIAADWDIHDALKAAAVAAGAPFVGMIEDDYPDSAVVTTTLSAQATSGFSSFTTAARLPNGPVEFGTGSNRRRVYAEWSSGTYVSTLSGGTVAVTYASGSTVTSRGRSLWTGSGKVGSTAGNGNADTLVSSDGVHPSPAGHDAIARWVAERLRALLAA